MVSGENSDRPREPVSGRAFDFGKNWQNFPGRLNGDPFEVAGLEEVTSFYVVGIP